MSKWSKVPKERREAVFAYNRRLAAQSTAAADMHALAAAMGRLPPGQLKGLLTDEVTAILARYGVEVTP